MICSRILFLLTYNTTLKFDSLFDEHALAQSIHNVSQSPFHLETWKANNVQDIARQGARYAKLLQDNKTKDFDARPLTESLKLLFNVTQFYPNRVPAFTKTIKHIILLLSQIIPPSPALQTPVTSLINALLNLDLPGEESLSSNGKKDSPLFPANDPASITQRLISILDKGIRSEKDVEKLEISATPVISVLRRINAIAPPAVVQTMKTELLPSSTDRDQPLGRSDTLSSRLLRLTTSPAAPKLKEQISYLLFELSDSDALTFTRNVGYGYAAGFLMTHNIPAPESLSTSGQVTTVDGQEINPITGQRRDMETEDAGPEMTDEEKEREAEKLFVLFERLQATGVVNVVNPVEQAQREGRFEELE